MVSGTRVLRHRSTFIKLNSMLQKFTRLHLLCVSEWFSSCKMSTGRNEDIRGPFGSAIVRRPSSKVSGGELRRLDLPRRIFFLLIIAKKFKLYI